MYSKTLGLGIDSWGPSTWNTMHTFAHCLPDVLPADDAHRFRGFLWTVARFLPCPACRTHFAAYLDVHMTHRRCNTRADAVRFLNDAHNDVNRRLRKREWTLREHYEVYAVETVRVGPKLGVASAATCCALVIVVCVVANEAKLFRRRFRQTDRF